MHTTDLIGSILVVGGAGFCVIVVLIALFIRNLMDGFVFGSLLFAFGMGVLAIVYGSIFL